MFYKIIYRTILILLTNLLFISYSSPLDKKTGQKNHKYLLERKIETLLANPLLSSASIGIRVVSLQNGKVLYKLNENKLFHPASNQKLILTYSALHLLNSNFLFRTYFGTNGVISYSILDGDLIVYGMGDPLLTTEDLDSISTLLYNSGIRAIRGDIIGNISYFDSIYWGKGWMWDDEPYPEAPFISPLSINKNAIKFFIKPGKENDTVLWKTDPQTSYIKVINKAISSSDSSIQDIFISRKSKTNIFTIEGKIFPTDTIKEISLSVWKPEEYFLQLLYERLYLKGITCNGSLNLTDERPILNLFTFEHSLDSVLHKINKESDNLAAEILLKTIGAECLTKYGNSSEGIKVIKEFLHTKGIDTLNLVIVDGSGSSWYNAVSPKTITDILTFEYHDKSTFNRFYESLSISGIDGTLKNRMVKDNLKGKVHAKTGSLSGVSTISGYLTMKNGEMAAFSIMINHFTCNNNIVRNIQDDIIKAIVNYGRK